MLSVSIPHGTPAPLLHSGEAPTDIYRDQPTMSVPQPLVRFREITPVEALFLLICFAPLFRKNDM